MSKNILVLEPDNGNSHLISTIQTLKKEKGYKFYLIDEVIDDVVPGVFEKVFKFDLINLTESVDFIKSLGIKFDSVVTKSCEAFPVLISVLAKEFGFKYNDPKTAFYCRNKYFMRDILKKNNIAIPKFKLVKNFEELKVAVKEIGTDCVAKPIGAHSSYGTFLIKQNEDLKSVEHNYNSSIKFLTDLHNGVGGRTKEIPDFTKEEMKMLGFENIEETNIVTDYLIEECMVGKQISVDSITQDGVTTVMGIADQIRMTAPYFIQLAEKMPYICDDSMKQKIEDLVKNTVKAMGVTNSTSHTEVMITSEGPKIVETASRTGSDNIVDFVYETTGYNLFYENIMLSLGEKREYNVPKNPKCYMAMEYVLPSKTGILRNINIPDEVKNDKDVTDINFFGFEMNVKVGVPPMDFDFLGYISVKGNSPEEAERKLKEVVSKIKIDIE